MAFRFRLHDQSANNLGDFVTAVPNWTVGDEFSTDDGRRYRILKIVWFLEDNAPFNAIWMVEPLAR